MIDSTTREYMLENVAADLLSIPPLLFREIRSKLIKMTLSDTDVHISPLNYEIMSLLEATGTIHMARIGEELNVARAQLTHLIDKLVRLKMVERKMGKTDRRTANISLTEYGRAYLDARKERLLDIVMELMSSLPDEELQELSDTFKKVRDLLSKLQETATLTF